MRTPHYSFDCLILRNNIYSKCICFLIHWLTSYTVSFVAGRLGFIWLKWVLWFVAVHESCENGFPGNFCASFLSHLPEANKPRPIFAQFSKKSDLIWS